MRKSIVAAAILSLTGFASISNAHAEFGFVKYLEPKAENDATSINPYYIGGTSESSSPSVTHCVVKGNNPITKAAVSYKFDLEIAANGQYSEATCESSFAVFNDSGESALVIYKSSLGTDSALDKIASSVKFYSASGQETGSVQLPVNYELFSYNSKVTRILDSKGTLFLGVFRELKASESITVTDFQLRNTLADNIIISVQKTGAVKELNTTAVCGLGCRELSPIAFDGSGKLFIQGLGIYSKNNAIDVLAKIDTTTENIEKIVLPKIPGFQFATVISANTKGEFLLTASPKYKSYSISGSMHAFIYDSKSGSIQDLTCQTDSAAIITEAVFDTDDSLIISRGEGGTLGLLPSINAVVFNRSTAPVTNLCIKPKVILDSNCDFNSNGTSALYTALEKGKRIPTSSYTCHVKVKYSYSNNKPVVGKLVSLDTVEDSDNLKGRAGTISRSKQTKTFRALTTNKKGIVRFSFTMPSFDKVQSYRIGLTGPYEAQGPTEYLELLPDYKLVR